MRINEVPQMRARIIKRRIEVKRELSDMGMDFGFLVSSYNSKRMYVVAN
jgi:hypothetical protein